MSRLRDKVRILLEWCAHKHIKIDDRIGVNTDNRSGIAVFAQDEYNQPQNTLVKIPKSAILSVRSCSLAKSIPKAPYGIAAQLSLSLALYSEILQGSESQWYGYLQSLPQDVVDLPLFWDIRHEANTCSTYAQEATTGISFLRGTEAGKIHDETLENGRTKLEEVTQFYHEVAEPLLQATVDRSDNPTLSGFYRAFSLVSSRAFLVDAYHGLSMVPVADVFNHSRENHVHLESDYNVCCECGSLQECIHDREDGAALSSVTNSSNEHDLYYEMVSNTAIPPHAEIFNTYGEGLTNAQLLNQYGFILDVNENDRLFWSVDDVLKTLMSGPTPSAPQRLIQDLRDVSLYLEEDIGFASSQLVYPETSGENAFCLDSDGKMSHHLWLAIFVLSVWREYPHDGRMGPDIAQMLLRVWTLQTELEDTHDEVDASMESDVESGRSPIGEAPSQSSLVLLDRIAHFAIQLCAARKAASGPEGLSAEQLSDIVDAELMDVGGGAASRTGLAISVLLGERSILDACEAAWKTLLESRNFG